jgi:hypothetical protein
MTEPVSPIKPSIGPLQKPKDEITDELNLVKLQAIANTLEAWPNKIRHYYRDHKATREEAEVICKICLSFSEKLREVRTLDALKTIMAEIEVFNQKFRSL